MGLQGQVKLCGSRASGHAQSWQEQWNQLPNHSLSPKFPLVSSWPPESSHKSSNVSVYTNLKISGAGYECNKTKHFRCHCHWDLYPHSSTLSLMCKMQAGGKAPQLPPNFHHTGLPNTTARWTAFSHNSHCLWQQTAAVAVYTTTGWACLFCFHTTSLSCLEPLSIPSCSSNFLFFTSPLPDLKDQRMLEALSRPSSITRERDRADT